MNLPPHVQKHGNGYRGRKRLDGIEARTKTYPTPEDAYEAIVRVISEYRSGPDEVVTLHEAGERLLRHTEKIRSEATAAFYKQTLGYIYKELGKTTALFRISTDDIQEMVDKWTEDTSPATAVVRFRVIRRLLRWSVKKGWVRSSVHEGVELRRVPKKEMHWFHAEELRAVIQRVLNSGRKCARRDADVILFLAQTGLRRSELARATVEDLAPDSLWVRGKNDERRVPIREALSDVCQRFVDGRTSGPLVAESVSTINNLFARWQEELSEPRLHPHAMRHTFVFMLVDANVPVNRVAELAGHKTIGTTMKYFHARTSGLRDAVEGLPQLGQ